MFNLFRVADMNAVLKEKLAVSGNGEYAALLLVTVLTFMGFYCPQPLLATVATEAHVSQPVASLMMTVTILPFAVAPFLYGKLLHFLTLTRLLMLALIGAGASLCLAGLSGSFAPALFFRTIQGILLPAILLCLTTRLGVMYSGRTLQTRMATYAAMTMVGAYGGRILAGVLCSAFSTGVTLVSFGVMQLLAVFPALLIADAEKIGSHEFTPSAVLDFLCDKKLLPVLLIGPVCIFGYSAVLNFLPFHLRHLDSAISESTVGLVYICGIVSACVTMGSRRLLKILRGEWNLLLAATVVFFLFLPLFAAPSMVASCAAMLGASVGFAIIYGNSPGMVNRASAYDKGMTNSMYLCIYYLCSALGSVIPVMVYDSFGSIAFILLEIGIMAADAALILFARNRITLK